MARRFLKQDGMRQNADVSGIEGIRSVGECSFACLARAQACVGFNFNPGANITCELCRAPYDGPNSDMAANTTWDHYAIEL